MTPQENILALEIEPENTTKICNESCRECVICENNKLCCAHNLNVFAHACSTWIRKKK